MQAEWWPALKTRLGCMVQWHYAIHERAGLNLSGLLCEGPMVDPAILLF